MENKNLVSRQFAAGRVEETQRRTKNTHQGVRSTDLIEEYRNLRILDNCDPENQLDKIAKGVRAKLILEDYRGSLESTNGMENEILRIGDSFKVSKSTGRVGTSDFKNPL